MTTRTASRRRITADISCNEVPEKNAHLGLQRIQPLAKVVEALVRKVGDHALVDFLFVRQIVGVHFRELRAGAARGTHQHAFPGVKRGAAIAVAAKVLGFVRAAVSPAVVRRHGGHGVGVHPFFDVHHVPLQNVVLVGRVRDFHKPGQRTRRLGGSDAVARGRRVGRVLAYKRHGVQHVRQLFLVQVGGGSSAIRQVTTTTCKLGHPIIVPRIQRAHPHGAQLKAGRGWMHGQVTRSLNSSP